MEAASKSGNRQEDATGQLGGQRQPRAPEILGHKTDIAELVPGSLYVLGGRLKLDRWISWAPPEAWGSYQPLNCYLLRNDDAALLIDPGPMCHQDVLGDQLAELLPPGAPVSIYLTRAEFDTFGSVRKLVEDGYEVRGLYAAGHANPFDAFDYLADVYPVISDRVALERVAGGTAGTIAGRSGMTIIRPSLRILVTYWVYDATAETLFTSDTFVDGTLAEPVGDRVMSDAHSCDVSTVRAHLVRKFWWLPYAGPNCQMLLQDLEDLFSRYSIRTIAPCRGRVIQGPDAVQHYYHLVDEALSGIAEDGPPDREPLTDAREATRDDD